MKLKKGFKLRPLAREFILTAEDISQVNFNKMISMNSTAAYLWEAVADKEFTAGDLAALLVEKYEVDEATALKDSESIAEKWIEAGIAEE